MPRKSIAAKNGFMAKGLIEIDPFHRPINGKEEAGHRNLGNNLCGCWWNCLVFKTELCCGNVMGSCWVNPT